LNTQEQTPASEALPQDYLYSALGILSYLQLLAPVEQVKQLATVNLIAAATASKRRGLSPARYRK